MHLQCVLLVYCLHVDLPCPPTLPPQPLLGPTNMDLLFFIFASLFYGYGVYLHSGYESPLVRVHVDRPCGMSCMSCMASMAIAR